MSSAAMYVTIIEWLEDGCRQRIILMDPEAVDALRSYFKTKGVSYTAETSPVYGMYYVQTLIGG